MVGNSDLQPLSDAHTVERERSCANLLPNFRVDFRHGPVMQTQNQSEWLRTYNLNTTCCSESTYVSSVQQSHVKYKIKALNMSGGCQIHIYILPYSNNISGLSLVPFSNFKACHFHLVFLILLPPQGEKT